MSFPPSERGGSTGDGAFVFGVAEGVLAAEPAPGGDGTDLGEGAAKFSGNLVEACLVSPAGAFSEGCGDPEVFFSTTSKDGVFATSSSNVLSFFLRKSNMPTGINYPWSAAPS